MPSVRTFFKYAVPSTVSMWIFSLYTIVDGIFVARGVGTDALAAVNLAAPFTAMVFAVGLLFAVGTSTVISITLGEGKKELANHYFNQNLLVLALLSLAITAASLLNLDKIVRFLGASPVTQGYTKEYVGVIAAFSIFFIVSYNLEVLVKVDGAPQLSAVGVTCCALMNVALDYLFVMRMGWGVRGAAVATGIAQVTSTVILGAYLFARGKKLRFGKFRFHLPVYRRILPLGLSDGVTELSNGIVIFLFNRTILSVVGEAGIVSYTVVSYVNTLVLMTMAGITQGIQPLVSYHHGANNRRAGNTYLRYGVTAVTVCSLLFYGAAQLATRQIVGLFIDPAQGELFAYSMRALRMFSTVFLLLGFNVVLAGFFTAIERPAYSLTVSLGRGLVLLAAGLLALVALFGEAGIWYAPAVSDALCLVASLGFLYRYRKEAQPDQPLPRTET